MEPAAFESSVNYSPSAASEAALQSHNLIGAQESGDDPHGESNIESDVGWYDSMVQAS